MAQIELYQTVTCHVKKLSQNSFNLRVIFRFPYTEFNFWRGIASVNHDARGQGKCMWNYGVLEEGVLFLLLFDSEVLEFKALQLFEMCTRCRGQSHFFLSQNNGKGDFGLTPNNI